MLRMPEISIVVPTLRRAALLRRVLDHLERQATPAGSFEVLVVADANEQDVSLLDRAIADRPYSAKRLRAERPGASAARNVGWRVAAAPLILFVDDDILPEPSLV